MISGSREKTALNLLISSSVIAHAAPEDLSLL